MIIAEPAYVSALMKDSKNLSIRVTPNKIPYYKIYDSTKNFAVVKPGNQYHSMILANLFVDDDSGDIVTYSCVKPTGIDWITLSPPISYVGYTVDLAPQTG